jgi:hypothetical protein
LFGRPHHHLVDLPLGAQCRHGERHRVVQNVFDHRRLVAVEEAEGLHPQRVVLRDPTLDVDVPDLVEQIARVEGAAVETFHGQQRIEPPPHRSAG